MRGIIIDKIYMKIESESQKLRMGEGCWTINLGEISGKQIEEIQYMTPKHIYSISLNDARKKGFIRNFQGELKLIVPIRAWSIEKCLKK
jgi:hypothetical protein